MTTRKSEKRRRGAIVSVRFTESELAILESKAAAAGVTMSGYLREEALRQAYPPAEQRTYGCEHVTLAGAFNEPPSVSCCGELSVVAAVSGTTPTDKDDHDRD